MLQFTAYLLEAQNMKYVCSPLFLSQVGLGPGWVGYAARICIHFMATGKRLPLNFD